MIVVNKKNGSWIARHWEIVLFSVIVFALYSVINWLTPLWCDDLDYGADGHTFADIFHREFHDYLYANGRIFSHTLVQLFVGMFGKALFNLVNPIMTLLMIMLLVFASGINLNTKEDRWSMFFFLSISFFLVWFVLPDQYITMFMVAGSSNYIWAAVLNLLFISAFMRFLVKDKELKNWAWVGMCILSFFAGAWMEMYSVALTPALFFCLILKRNYRNKKALVSFGLYSIGAIVVIFAPGNFVRQGLTFGGRANVSTWLVNQLELAIKFKLIWVWICSSVLIVYELLKKRIYIKEFLVENMVWLVGILVAYAFLFVSGVNSWRSQWSVFLFSFIILFWLLGKVQVNRLVCLALSTVVLIVICIDFSREYCACLAKNNAVAEMLHQAKTESLTENRYYLWPNTSDSRKSIPVPTGMNGCWPGNSFAMYHNLYRFIIMPEMAYPYCSGEELDYPLYYGLFPMVDGCAIVKRKDASNQNVTIIYGYDVPTVFVFSSKIRRLLGAMGINGLARKAYVSKNELFFGGFLLKAIDPSELEVSVGSGVENVYFFDYQGEWYLVVPLEMMKPKCDLTVNSCELQR